MNPTVSNVHGSVESFALSQRSGEACGIQFSLAQD